MKDVILKDWGWIRILRLVFSLYLLFKAYTIGESIYYLIGAVLLYQAVFNVKCFTGTCTDNSCIIEHKTNETNK